MVCWAHLHLFSPEHHSEFFEWICHHNYFTGSVNPHPLLLPTGTSEFRLTIKEEDTIRDAGTSYAYACLLDQPDILSEYIKTSGSLAWVQEELGVGEYWLTCKFEENGLKLSKRMKLSVVLPEYPEVYLSLNAIGPQLRWSNWTNRPARCSASQPIASFPIKWKQLFGTEKFTSVTSSTDNNRTQALLYTERNAAKPSDMATYVCQMPLPTRCLSKILLQAYF
ncbi:unnamed protein product, partial [Dicrocoelium dendriticum]